MDLYGPPIDSTAFSAQLFPASVSAPPYPGHESTALLGEQVGGSANFVRVFSADAPTYLSTRPRKPAPREGGNVTHSSERESLASPVSADSVVTGAQDRMDEVADHAESNSALAKAAKYRTQLLLALKSDPESTLGDDVVARLRLLEKRIELYSPRVSREQWARLDQVVGVAESAADLRAKVRLALAEG